MVKVAAGVVEGIETVVAVEVLDAGVTQGLKQVDSAERMCWSFALEDNIPDL